MALDIHIKRLQKQYPEEPKEIIQLACFLHDNIDKAKGYATDLSCCNNYHDIAWQVVKDMYITCQIDDETALKEKTFIRFLLDLSNYGKQGQTHSARHHIYEMVKDAAVIDERKKYQQLLLDKRKETEANEEIKAESSAPDISKMEEVTISFPIQYRESSVPVIQALANKGIIVVKKSTLRGRTILPSNQKSQYIIKGSRNEIIDCLKYIETRVNHYSVTCYSRSRTSLGHPRKRNAIGISGVRIELPTSYAKLGSVRNIHISQGIAMMGKLI